MPCSNKATASQTGSEKRQPPLPKCWIYETEEGWRILAGKTDADNDLLSPKLNTETQSAPEKKDTTNTVKMGM